MSYLLLSQPKAAYAEALSAALWGISRPVNVRTEKDTQLYTSWVVHPESGAVALFVPDDTRPVHVEADVKPLVDLITDMPLTVSTTDMDGNAVQVDTTVSNYLESRKGGRISFRELVEASPMAVNLTTRTKMEADGWFPADDLI